MTKKSWREQHRGADLGELMRIGARNLWNAAERNTKRREQDALKFQYTTAQTLDVFVEQVTPTLWRMQTVAQVIGEQDPICVVEQDSAFLEPELRNCIQLALLQHGYTKHAQDPAAEARKWARELRIRIVDRILLRDSQRHHAEWNR